MILGEGGLGRNIKILKQCSYICVYIITYICNILFRYNKCKSNFLNLFTVKKIIKLL